MDALELFLALVSARSRENFDTSRLLDYSIEIPLNRQYRKIRLFSVSYRNVITVKPRPAESTPLGWERETSSTQTAKVQKRITDRCWAGCS